MRFPGEVRCIDFLLIAAALAAAVFLGIQVYSGNSASPVLIIESPDGRWMYPADSSVEADIPGPLGMTHVVLENGAARITDSPCPNRTCIASPPISRPGTWSACLPNRVLIRIDGHDPSALDAVGH